jgi:RIO kinase 1
LYNAGADVPRPIAASSDAILIEYFGDEDEAAQQLNRVRLPAGEAGSVFERLMRNVELMLACDRVHGDLSPHNVLGLLPNDCSDCGFTSKELESVQRERDRNS